MKGLSWHSANVLKTHPLMALVYCFGKDSIPHLCSCFFPTLSDRKVRGPKKSTAASEGVSQCPTSAGFVASAGQATLHSLAQRCASAANCLACKLPLCSFRANEPRWRNVIKFKSLMKYLILHHFLCFYLVSKTEPIYKQRP